MPELTTDDVVAFTSGRLEDGAEVQRMLDVALSAARRYAGWHVSPVRVDDEVIIDGPASRALLLPTKKLVELTEVVEDGSILALTGLRWTVAADYVVRVRKRSNAFWTGEYASISVTMTHGYTEAEAADWRHAVLSMVDQISLVPVGGQVARSSSDLVRKQVDDVEYQWAPLVSGAMEQALYSVSSVLDAYCLPPVEWL
jgi:hypothetical protein